MIHPIRYLRGYVYPRGMMSYSPPTSRSGTDDVFGVCAVLLSVGAFAYILTVLSGL